MAHLPLRALDALLTAERDEEPPAKAFELLQEIFAFDQALLLQGGEDGMRCVAAIPETLSELQWSPGPFFREIAGGAVAATSGDRGFEEWRSVAGDLISPAQPALYLPYCGQGRRGVLILLRAIGKDAFDEADLSLARQFAVVGLAALAARHAQTIEAEFQGLRGEHDAEIPHPMPCEGHGGPAGAGRKHTTCAQFEQPARVVSAIQVNQDF